MSAAEDQGMTPGKEGEVLPQRSWCKKAIILESQLQSSVIGV
jgi:hypothetical protein